MVRIPRGSDVRMYDTHYPGFCYKRNGEYRIPVSQNNVPVMSFDELHQLLFTNGEIDIEKVLCLHLLAVHKSESIVSPSRDNSMRLRDMSPVERLIERSKRKKTEDSLTRVLPMYVLEVDSIDSNGKTNSEKTLIRDGRLAARLFINEKIVQLIENVLIALQQSDPKKVEELVEMASNPDVLRKILEKAHIQEFLESLKNHVLISSCESFRLTQPFKAKFSTISIQTVKGGLENLVKLIRRSILQTPKSMWAEKIQKSQPIQPAEDTSGETPNREVSITDTSRQSSNKFTKKDFITKNKEALNKVKKLEYEEKYEEVPSPRRRSRNSSIDERLVRTSSLFNSEFKPSRRNSDEEKYAVLHTVEEIPLNPEMLAEIIKNKVESAYKRDLSITNHHTHSNIAQETLTTEKSKDEIKQDTQKDRQQKLKYPYIKKTTCEACSSKWKQPLPAPKTPLIKRNCIPTLDQDTYKEVATESTHRISQIIDKEYNKLRPRQNSKSGSVSSNRSSKTGGRESFLKKYSTDTVELSEMDLAKIRQEIKEKETQKKLDKFLQENNK